MSMAYSEFISLYRKISKSAYSKSDTYAVVNGVRCILVAHGDRDYVRTDIKSSERSRDMNALAEVMATYDRYISNIKNRVMRRITVTGYISKDTADIIEALEWVGTQVVSSVGNCSRFRFTVKSCDYVYMPCELASMRLVVKNTPTGNADNKHAVKMYNKAIQLLIELNKGKLDLARRDRKELVHLVHKENIAGVHA